MGFLEGLGKKVADAGQKTKGMTDVARLELLVKKEENKLNQIYSRIGKLYVDMHMDDHEEAFSGMFSEFQETTQTIRNYNQQIAQIKDGWNSEETAEVPPASSSSGKCPNCGAAIPEGSSFCRFCGKPIPQQEAPNPNAETEEKYCVNCGEKIEADAAFCTKCGARQ